MFKLFTLAAAVTLLAAADVSAQWGGSRVRAVGSAGCSSASFHSSAAVEFRRVEVAPVLQQRTVFVETAPAVAFQKVRTVEFSRSRSFSGSRYGGGGFRSFGFGFSRYGR